MAYLHGKNAIVYLQCAGAEAEPIAQIEDYSIDNQFQLEGSAVLGDAATSNVRGMETFKGTLSGNYDDAQSILWASHKASTHRKMYLYADRNAPLKYYYGFVWVLLPTVLAGGIAKKATTVVGVTGDSVLGAAGSSPVA